MSRDDKVETVLDQFGLRRLHPHNRLFSGVRQRSTFEIEWVEAPLGYCMFATGLITAEAVGRVCELTGCFCPPNSFKDSRIFQTWSSRVGEQETEQR